MPSAARNAALRVIRIFVCMVRLARGECACRLFVDDAVFHYEGYFLQGGDVVERIAGDGDDIGEVAGL